MDKSLARNQKLQDRPSRTVKYNKNTDNITIYNTKLRVLVVVLLPDAQFYLLKFHQELMLHSTPQMYSNYKIK